MVKALLVFALLLQCGAVAYGIYLLTGRKGPTGAWLFLLGAMSSMLAWRVLVVVDVIPPAYFNPVIAIWGSTCMVGAMFLFGREVLARQRAEAERDALLASERAARVEAEQASRAKDEFLATLSHELRSPLAAILGWCAVLRRSPPAGRDLDTGLGVIERNARAQSRLVDDLLDVTRMRSGTLHLNTEVLRLARPVRSAIQAVRPRADARTVNIDLQFDGDGPAVLGDVDRLRQVVTNLLENAVRFTPNGGTVTVTVVERSGEAVLDVTDTGQGIDPEFLPHVFARFRQGDGTPTRRHGGLGIGLSIVDHLVRLHGGSVTAHSKGLGQGSTFVVKLPLATQTVTHRSTPESVPILTRPLQDLRLLLVDDEEDVRSATVRILEQMGATVVALEGGDEIAAALIQFRPHVLILDIGMPGEDGYSLIRRVRRLPLHDGGATPAISLTAHARSEDRARALDAGFDAHLPKPIDVAELVATLRTLAAPVGVVVEDPGHSLVRAEA